MDIGQRPRPVTKRQLAGEFEAVVQANILEILDEIKDGKRAPLNLMCVSYSDYLTLAELNQDALRWIGSAAAVFDSIDRQADDIRSGSSAPPD